MGPMRLTATLADAAGVSFTVAGVNDWGKSSSASILTPEFGAPDAGGGDEIRLAPASNDGVQYRVAAQAWAAPSLLPLAPGELGLIARGDAAATLHQFALGDVLALRLDSMPPVDAIAAALGGGPLLVQGGKPVTDPSAPAPEETNVRYPVTGAGVSADGSTMWLVVVDGRAPATSVGITRPMLASLFVALGAAQAMAFDSGGSSEMVVRHLGDVRAAVANTPSDGRERPIADALLVLNTATPGPPSRLILNATAPNVLVGSHE
jgi:hypothetical protein